MPLFRRNPPPDTATPFVIRREDQATVLRYRWYARMHRLVHDEASAALCDNMADLTEEYATLKAQYLASGKTDEVVDLRRRQVRTMLRDELGYWRGIREYTQGGHFPVLAVELNIPTDDELLAGA